MKIKNRLLLVGWVIAGALVLASARPSVAQEKKNIRMVFVSLAWNSELPFRAALARGFFKAQGLQVEPILIRGGPAAIAALASGEADFASIGGAQAVFRSKARGLDLSIIGCISNTTNYILLGDKQTRTIEELKGKNIGVTGAGTYSEFAVRAFLKKKQYRPGKRCRTTRDRRDGLARSGAREGNDFGGAFFDGGCGPFDAQRLSFDQQYE